MALENMGKSIDTISITFFIHECLNS
jgi:hypothetical protein